MLLYEKITAVKLCLSTIIGNLKWNKEKTIRQFAFEINYGGWSKNLFKVMRDKFLSNSNQLDEKKSGKIFSQVTKLKKDVSNKSAKFSRSWGTSKTDGPSVRRLSSSCIDTGHKTENVVALLKNYSTSSGTPKGGIREETIAIGCGRDELDEPVVTYRIIILMWKKGL